MLTHRQMDIEMDTEQSKDGIKINTQNNSKTYAIKCPLYNIIMISNQIQN